MKKLTAVLLVFAFVLAAPLMASAQDMLDQRLSKVEEMVKGLKMSQKMGFHLYASLRPHLGYYDVDEDYAAVSGALEGPAMDPSIGVDDSGTLLSIGGQSRLGAKAIATKDLYGVIEFGLTETARSGEVSDPYLRLAYGVWNFGAGKLTVGKDYTPGTFLGYSSMMGDLGDQGDANMLVAGLSYIGRQPQVKLSFGDFDIALIEQNTGAAAYGGDKDFYLPRIEAAYVFRLDNINIRPVAGYQTYEVEDRVVGGTALPDEDIDSFLLGLGVSATFDPVYVKGTVSFMQNALNYGQSNLVLANGTLANTITQAQVGTDVEDSDLLQGTLVAGAKLNEKIGLEAGVGYLNAEVDIAGLGTAEQTGMVYYFQAPVQLAKGMQLIPEIGMVDRGDFETDVLPDQDSGTMSYIDFNFRVDL